jgi:glycine cleavage system aminomethyltransferase T
MAIDDQYVHRTRLSRAGACPRAFHATEDRVALHALDYARGVGRITSDHVAVRPALHPNVRRSPYFEATERSGALEYMVYNHMYMAIAFANDPHEEYRAMVERVCLWDVGAERQTQLQGPDAVRFANFLCTRDLRRLEVGQCRFTMVCDDNGKIMTEPIVLRPWDDVIWISHGDVDLTLWAAGLGRAEQYDVQISEPDVAPIQIQGPRSLELVASIAPAVEDLDYYRCTQTTIAGHPCIVSRTGWSRGLGYEVFPLGTERAMEVWDALETAGAPLGGLVAGPNLNRAVEQGITDTHYFVNSGMTPYEAGAARLVDLESAPFIGSDALVDAAGKPQYRHTLGLVLDDSPGRLEQFWTVESDDGPVGEVRWAAYSYELETNVCIALLASAVNVGDRVTVLAPDGPVGAIAQELPFVT